MAAPTVTTTSVTGVTATAATSGGSVTSEGGKALTAFGVCWNTSGSPTVADAHTNEVRTGTGALTAAPVQAVGSGSSAAAAGNNPISLSVAHAAIGATVTISGTGFGSTRGTSTVWFGELPYTFARDNYVLRPCAREANTYVSWSDTQIVVTVPSMSPGHVDYPGTYHPVYVEVGGVATDRANFYIDPVVTLDGNSSIAAWEAVFPYSTVTKETNVYTSSAGSKHASYATTVTLDSTIVSPTTGNWLATFVHDILIMDASFVNESSTGTGYNAGVLTMGMGAQDNYCITFANCVVHNNMTRSGDDAMNGVKTFYGEQRGRNGDWTFCDCSIGTPNSPSGSHGRMGMEFNEGDFSAGHETEVPLRIRVTGCDLEPADCEPFSYNCGWLAVVEARPHRQHLIDDCLVKGAGAAGGNSQWGAYAFESTAIGMMVRDVDIWAHVGATFNLEGWGNTLEMHHVFHHITVDMDHLYQTTQGGGNMVVSSTYRRGVVFDDCDINTGTNVTSCYRGMDWNENPNTCRYWDWSTSYIHGNMNWGGSGDYFGTPANVYQYWAYNVTSDPWPAALISYPQMGSRP